MTIPSICNRTRYCTLYIVFQISQNGLDARVWECPYRAEPLFFQLLLLSGTFQSCDSAVPSSCALLQPTVWKNHPKAHCFLLHLSQRSASRELENIELFIKLGILDSSRLQKKADIFMGRFILVFQYHCGIFFIRLNY